MMTFFAGFARLCREAPPSCRVCDGRGLPWLDYACVECDPSCALEASPVQSTFNIDAAGVVTWAGWCAPDLNINRKDGDR